MADFEEFSVAMAASDAVEPMMQIPSELPALPLRDIVIYPFMIVPLFVSRDKSKDMIWPDMMWFWIIAYDLWNFAYVYNCVGDHAFYAGAALLISCTIPAFFIKKGAWLQHRAHTLALWMMFTMAVPTFVTSSQFAVESSHNPTALFVVSALSLAANVAVAAYQVFTIVTRHRNPLRDELYTHLRPYREVRDANLPVESPTALPGSRETDRLATV